MNIYKLVRTKLTGERPKKILVTGAAGFIGSHLFYFLKGEGHKVVGIDNFSHACGRKMDEVKWADVRYYKDIEDYVSNVDIVYHLAAQIHVDKSIDHVEETLDVNIMGTYNILEACRKYGKRLIFASTSEVYGGEGVQDEGSPTYAQSPYAVSKLAGDKLAGNYHELYGVRLVRMRNFNTFGPWQNQGAYGAVIPIFVRHALEGKQLPIFGDGEQKRDFMYIDDAIYGYKIATDFMHGFEGEPVNIGSGKTISINELGQLICNIIGTPFRPKYLQARPGEVKQLQADISLIKKMGYRPVVGLEQGLEKYIEWYKQYGKTK
jgi:nucleoside-diphosphate-sugar epimerase